jgi:hypothetical protein
MSACRHVGSGLPPKGIQAKLLVSKQAACFATFFILLNYPQENLEIKERKVGTPFALLSSLPVVAMCHRTIESLSQEILT